VLLPAIPVLNLIILNSGSISADVVSALLSGIEEEQIGKEDIAMVSASYQ